MRRIGRRQSAAALLMAGIATIGTGFALEGTASADPVFTHTNYDLHLKDVHHDAEWLDFRSEADCDDAATTEALPYAWHFVVPDYPANPNTQQNPVNLPDVTAVYGAFDVAGLVSGGNVVQNGKGWYLYTATADELLDAVGDSTATHAPNPLVMNLSHTCGPIPTSSSSSSSTGSSSSSSISSSSLSSSSQSSSTSQSSTSQSSSSQSSSSQSSSTSQTSTSQTSSSNTSSSASQTSSSETSSSPSVSHSSSSESVVGSSLTNNPSSVKGGAPNGPDVGGTQVSRTLPRTGIDPGFLLMLGGMLVVSGVLLMRYSDETA